MNINIPYFHQGKVLSQYLDSQFLGHATAIDLLQAFKKETSKLNPYKQNSCCKSVQMAIKSI